LRSRGEFLNLHIFSVISFLYKQTDMEVYCLEDDALYELVEQVYQRMKDKDKEKDDKWISAEEAMHKLRISSKTTLQKLRDEGKIRYSQPEKKHIVYDIESLYSYLEKHAK
jgi:hypothetical protein